MNMMCCLLPTSYLFSMLQRWPVSLSTRSREDTSWNANSVTPHCCTKDVTKSERWSRTKSTKAVGKRI